jgi:hypothetical protein
LKKTKNIDWASIAQVTLSSLGLLFSLTLAGSMFFLGLIDQVLSSNLSESSSFQLFAMFWTALMVMVLFIPSIYYGLMRLMQKPITWQWPPITRKLPFYLMGFWPVLLLMGHLIVSQGWLPELLLPPIQVLAIAIPILFLINFGRRGFGNNSPQRSWGVVTFNLSFTQTIVIFVEVLLLLGLIILGMIWVASQPDLLAELNHLSDRLVKAQMSPEVVQRILSPYLESPITIFLILFYIAGLAPLMEEILKPIGMWLLAGKKISPQQGFELGMVCGGIFAFLESNSILLLPPDPQWIGLIIGRTGTGVMHIVASGIAGWGLALAWSKANYLKLALATLISFLIHGTWNSFSVFSAVAEMVDAQSDFGALIVQLGNVAPFVLVILALILFGVLQFSNARLRKVDA